MKKTEFLHEMKAIASLEPFIIKGDRRDKCNMLAESYIKRVRKLLDISYMALPEEFNGLNTN